MMNNGMKKRIAVVGAGLIGLRHIDAIRSCNTLSLAAVVGLDAQSSVLAAPIVHSHCPNLWLCTHSRLRSWLAPISVLLGLSGLEKNGLKLNDLLQKLCCDWFYLIALYLVLFGQRDIVGIRRCCEYVNS